MRLRTLPPVLALVFLPLSAIGQSPAVSYKTLDLRIEPGITAPIAGDFNGDRIPDLVVHMPEEIRIYPGDGRGGFATALATPIGGTETRRYPHAAITGDFNGDGKLDFFAFQRVFLGNGDGTLTPVGVVEIDDQPRLMDMNFDGIPDLAGMAGNRFLVFLGTRDGTFCNPVTSCMPWRNVKTQGVTALGDLNLDGSPDLVTASFNRQSVAIEISLSIWDTYIPEEDREWRASQLHWSWGTPKAIAIEDMNGDGWPDLVALGSWIAVAPGLGNGTFGEPYLAAFGTRTGYFESYDDAVLADFNGDGRLDMGYVMRYDEPDDGYEAGILFGDPQGELSHPNLLKDGFRMTGLVGVADWNGDGLPDLVWGNGTTLHLSVSSPFALSSATRRTLVAPGSLATVHGLHLTHAEVSAPRFGVPPKDLGGVNVRLDDGSTFYWADLVSVSPSQVNFRVPPDFPLGQMKGMVRGPFGTYEFSLWVRPQAPGIFTTNGVQAVAAVAASASTVDVVLYATGLNGVPASGTTVVVNGKVMAAESVFSIAGLAGLDLVRIQLPRRSVCQSPYWCGDALVRMMVGDAESNRVVLNLRSVR